MLKHKQISLNEIVIFVAIADKIIEFTLYGVNSEDIIIAKEDAIDNGEADIQIKEGHFYEYKISDGYFLKESEVITQSKINKSSGRLSPNIYVGTLSIDIYEIKTEQKCSKINIEVQSTKTSYREDYRLMLEDITEKCTDLLLQHNSPTSHFFEVDSETDAKTLYQRFAFVKSVLESNEFNESIFKILHTPITKWKESESIKDVRSLKRVKNTTLRQITNATNRINLPQNHPLKTVFETIPARINLSHKTETVDTPENQFVKYALISFLTFCNDIKSKAKESDRIKFEVELLEYKLNQYLDHSIFKDISPLKSIPLNSPVLQRKAGYRDILKFWLMFDLAAKLIWHGGDNVYSASKRDVATLYEYWLFFKLIDLIKEVFKIEPESTQNLIESTPNGLELKLKQGIYLPIKGIYATDTRKLNIEFSYNKTFSGNNEYPDGGSWTRNLRPDYTLSIWPYGINQEQAEYEELIVHIHFDAKYKIENLQTIFNTDENLDTEKIDQKKGTYKRADLLKMHTYKDAIRRTAGAYILYPGTAEQYIRTGFHELIPGLGAFSIRPSKTNNGTDQLKRFLLDIANHFMNRTSQREKMSLKTYETHKIKNSIQLNEFLPEAYGSNRSFSPDEIYVLIGFYKDKKHLDWILKSGLYNARTESIRGSLRLGIGETSAKYLLLHSVGELKTSKLFEIIEKGPRLFSKQALVDKNYPATPTNDYYLVYKITKTQEIEFESKYWDITRLSGYKSNRGSGLPFATTLAELMGVTIKSM